MSTANEEFVASAVSMVVTFASEILTPTLVIVWAAAVVLRVLVTFTITREHWFAKEFEKRVHRFIDSTPNDQQLSFFLTTKRILEKTYYELFEIRAIMKRRKPDMIRSLTDRLFLIQHGCANLVREAERQVKFLKMDKGQPRMIDISKNVFEHNPCFRRVMGIIPVAGANDLLAILPGILIVGGIFGTFMGILKSLPDLGGMDLNDPESTKTIIDAFLVRVSFSMSTSVVGIMLSVSLQIVNTILSAERSFITTVQRFENSLDSLWHRSTNNALPGEIPEFDEHKDPIDALAEEALNKELERKLLFVKKAS